MEIILCWNKRSIRESGEIVSAFKNEIRSSLFCNLMYSMISTLENFDGSPISQKMEMLVDVFFYDGSKWSIKKESSFIND